MQKIIKGMLIGAILLVVLYPSVLMFLEGAK